MESDWTDLEEKKKENKKRKQKDRISLHGLHIYFDQSIKVSFLFVWFMGWYDVV